LLETRQHTIGFAFGAGALRLGRAFVKQALGGNDIEVVSRLPVCGAFARAQIACSARCASMYFEASMRQQIGALAGMINRLRSRQRT
jgi:hypothetical protein